MVKTLRLRTYLNVHPKKLEKVDKFCYGLCCGEKQNKMFFVHDKKRTLIKICANYQSPQKASTYEKVPR